VPPAACGAAALAHTCFYAAVQPTLETAFALVAQVVVGIPFYTERDNVVSQLVTLRQVSTRRAPLCPTTTANNRVLRRCQVFQERRQYCLIVVIGEHSRCDLLEDIAIDDIEESEPCAPPSSEPHFARLITFWKPHKRYQARVLPVEGTLPWLGC